jgi:hypothetical protein
MHDLAGGLVLGYHGCDRRIGERLLAGEEFFQSQNEWDWLGHGIYFWEANPKRGLHFAQELKSKGRSPIDEPFVVGAVIQPGLCLDLTTVSGIEIVQEAFLQLQRLCEAADEALPTNSRDLLRRNLDCAVVQFAHKIRFDSGQSAIDTVRGVFVEGAPAYPNAGFDAKTHVQLAVRTQRCIKGVFRVAASQLE